MDTTISAPIARKYAHLSRVVANLQPSEVGRIFASATHPSGFLPAWGLHVAEFCCAYCNNLPHKRTDAARPDPKLDAKPAGNEEAARSPVASGRKRRRASPPPPPPPSPPSPPSNEDDLVVPPLAAASGRPAARGKDTKASADPSPRRKRR